MQILADQVALAIENTRLLAEAQQAVSQLEGLYSLQIRQGWGKRMADQSLAYKYDRRRGVETQVDAAREEELESRKLYPENGNEIQAPIELRGQKIGVLKMRRKSGDRKWSSQEQELLLDTVNHLALALENARLMEEVQSRAKEEAMISQIVARAQSSLNLENVMKTAVTEVGRALRLKHIRLRLGSSLEEAGDASPLAETAPQEEQDTPDLESDTNRAENPQAIRHGEDA
jgi:GAF domain-containing protein